MYLLYVDESGDPGISASSPSPYFFLAGLLLDSRQWYRLTRELRGFRQHLLHRYGLPMEAEIHASVFLSNRTPLAQHITANDRLLLLRECLVWCATRPYFHLLTTGRDKRQAPGDHVFVEVWEAYYRLFDDWLNQNSPPGQPQTGLVICDNTDGGKLTKLVRKLQQHPATAALPPLRGIVEDPFFRDSRLSYLHQLVDVVAYFAKQAVEPSNFIRSKGASGYFSLLAPINLIPPTQEQPWGIRML